MRWLLFRWDRVDIGSPLCEMEALLAKQASDMNKLWLYNTRSSPPILTHLAVLWPCYCRLSVCKQRFLGVCWFDCACWIWEWVLSDATVLHIDVRLLHEDLNSLRAKPRWHWNHRSSVQWGSHMTTRTHTNTDYSVRIFFFFMLCLFYSHGLWFTCSCKLYGSATFNIGYLMYVIYPICDLEPQNQS